MPKGPQGQKRPADAIGCAVNVARIATGKDVDIISTSSRHRSGVAGAKARAENLSADERRKIAKKAADARWEKKRRDVMAGTCQAALEARLFNTEGISLVNFKLLRGDDPSVTKEEICEEVHSAITQKIAGMATSHTDFPEAGDFESIDLSRLK